MLEFVKRAPLLAIAACGLAHAQPPELSAVTATAPPCDAARKTCIGLRLHVPVTDDGPIATSEWVERQLAAANKHFEKLDVAFQITGIDPMPATAERVEDKEERISFGPLITKDVIDVFVTGHLDDIDKPGEMVYGVTWWTTGDRKFVILSTQAWERTLAHELGHVFGLKHSKYAVSIMNKRKRTMPPIEDRTFHKHELAKMKPIIREMVRNKTLKNLATKRK